MKLRKRNFILKLKILVFSILLSNLLSKHFTLHANSWTNIYHQEKTFVENKGQFSIKDPSYFPFFEQNNFVYAGSNERIFIFKDKVVIDLFKKEFKINNDGEEEDKYEENNNIYEENNNIKIEHDYIILQWLNISEEASITPLEKDNFYHSYSFYDKNGNLKHINFVPSYRKIKISNIYKGIDLIYEIHPQSGIKYTFYCHKDAKISDIKYTYSNPAYLKKGSITVKSKFGDIIEHQPVAYFASNHHKIPIKFIRENDQFFFDLSIPVKEPLIIDPWIQTPNFPSTNWDCVWECETDGTGNVYIKGGTSPVQIIKYSPAGVLQWVYNTPYDTSSWLGTFATDLAGNSYVTQGSSAQILKLNSAGTVLWYQSSVGPVFSHTELWSIAFNCDQTQLIVGGTGGPASGSPLPMIHHFNTNNGSLINSIQVHNSAPLSQTPPNIQEVRSIISCNNGKYYFLTHDSIGYIHQSLNSSCTPGSNSFPFHVFNGIDLAYKCENYRYNNTGIMALAYFNGYVFVHRGNQLQKRTFNNATVVATANIPGGSFISGFGGNQVGCGGIDIDSCGFIYVGSTTALHKFDQNLNLIASYPVNFNIYDVKVNNNGEVICAGSTGNQNSNSRTGYVQSIPANACMFQAAVCCDATICQPSSYCINQPSDTLQVFTPGGSWSASCGSCINSSGIFNPQAAGVGTHTIYYSLPCGTDSIIVTVNSCAPVSVCKDTNGNLIATGGQGPFTWQQPDTIQDCSNCFFGLCNNIPPGCIQNVIVWQNFATGDTIPIPNQFPIKLVDASGTTLLINDTSSIPNCAGSGGGGGGGCPPVTLSINNITQPLCHGQTGSATVSMSGGTPPYTYSWTPGNLSGPNQSNLSPGTYTIIGSDSAGCSDTITLTINNPQPINITIVNIKNVSCGSTNDGSATISASGGTGNLQIVWNTSPPQNGNTANNLPPGNYWAVVTDANGCKDSIQITIGQDPTPNASIYAGKTNVCQGDTLHLYANGNGNYQWFENGQIIGTGSSIVVQPATNNSYVLVVSNGSCSDTAVININVTPQPNAYANPDTVITKGQSVQLSAGGGNSYLWSPATYLSCFNCPNPVASPPSTMTYCAKVMNSPSCFDTACVVIIVETICGEIFVPNIFSPNGDGRNETIKVHGLCIKEMTWEIFNRWGERVFITNDPSQSWDGTFRGKHVNNGIFHYHLKAVLSNGEIINQKGTITVVR